MKGLLVSCIAVFLSLGLVSAAENATTCPKDQAVSLLRAYAGKPYWHHFYTDTAEMNGVVTTPGPYTEELSPAPGTVPFYRTYNPILISHFLTTDLNERDHAINMLGYEDGGISGYIYPSDFGCSVPLYRLHYGNLEYDYFYTSDAGERDSAVKDLGFNYELIVGYILPL
ncbi:hypothetical protein ARMGADRAFT_1032998 [Armillaria gallica]|uniref:DUF5648 domain-containing protein n=1 Tax=Armillaria gallica TaxID=47427 RepID=A0A2H3D837_ARMGA|nr:hypothetical protein ARMGADRAFT_1032998 [Armillaria gallica]